MATRANLAVGIIGSTAKAVLWVALATLALGAFGGYAFAQQPAAADDKVLSKDELNTLVGKIALYPDDLVALVLPASTYPLQVVEAERFLGERKKDPSLKPSDKWDDSVVALLNYPEVVKLMNDDLDWTWKLGDAVINQRGEVLDAIQNFRGVAAAAGNLHTDEHQVVQNDDQGEVSIKPADPQVVYVPYYDPQQVVVSQPSPVYYYYPYGYPLYYYPYPYGYPFAAGYFWGVTTAFVIGWHSHYVHVVHCGYSGHPYYGHTYYGGYYVRHDSNPSMSHGHYVWEPHYRAGGQPFTRSDGRQLAIAHHDQNAGGAPSGYRGVNRDHNGDNGHGSYTGRYANGGHSGDGGHNANSVHSSDGGRSADGAHYGNGGHASDGTHNADRGPTAGARYPVGSQGTEGSTVPNAHGYPGFRGNGQSAGPSGSRDGTKQIQPIRNDPPTQAAIGSELRQHAPNQAAFTGQGSQSGRATTPGQPERRYTYQAPNQSTSFRDPALHGAPQTSAPQYRNAPQTPQYRNAPQTNGSQYRSAPQLNAPQVRSAPQIAPQLHGAPPASAPQMRTMPIPSAPTTMAMPHQGGASYAYRSPSVAPSMPQASSGHASAAHQGGGGGAAHGAQGHGGGGHGSR